MENSVNITPTPSGKPSTADLYKYSVGNAIDGVDPLPNPTTSIDAKKKAQSMLDKNFMNASRPDAFKFDKPTTFNAGSKGYNFDRYYTHPKFKQLGFTPLRDNESFYNQHSSTWDDLGRAVKQMPALVGLGASSTFGNWSSFLSMKPDTENAEEMERRMSIASSSRDTLGGKTVNFLSNVPYTLGVIGEIYAEEAALMLASRIPGMQGLAAAKTGQNILRGGLAFERLFNTFRAGNKIDNAKQAWDASKAAGNFAKNWLPFQNTAELFRDSGRAAANMDKLTDLAAGYKTFGAFYRDLREINLVTAEAKLEGGFVQNDVANTLIGDFRKKNGRDPNDTESEAIYTQARKAGYTAGFLNTGGIYISNKVVLERALKGLPFIDEVEHLAGKGIKNGKLVKNLDWKTSGKNPWEVISGVGSGVKALGNKYYRQQLVKNAPKNGMRFLSANVMEGVQEMYQEGTAKGVSDYYTQTYLNPSKVGKAQVLSSLQTGVKSQLSGEGLEVFLSGFLMAGPIQAVQSSVHGAYNMSQLARLKMQDKSFKADPANAGKTSPYEKYLKDQKVYNEKVVSALNFLTKDTKSYFSTVDANVKAQKDFADLFESAVLEGDVKGAVDANDDALANHIFTLIESGHLDLFTEHLEGLKQLDEKELADALYENPGNKTFDKKTTSERIDAVIGRINQIKDTHNKYQSLSNPFDFRQDPIGYFSFESARKLAIFNDFSYQRTGERMTSILEKLKTSTALSNVDYMDIATMFSINPKLMGNNMGIGGATNMLNLLKQEIDNLKAGTDEQKDEAVKLQNKYDKLKSLSTLIQDYAANLDTLESAPAEQQEELANSVEESEKLLGQAFNDYIKLLAKNNGTTILDKDINDAFSDFRDYWRLGRDKTQFAEAVNALNNPGYFSEVARRINGALEVASQVSAQRAKEEVDEYRRRYATNDFLNGLLSQFNVYVHEDEAEAYLANNIVPEKFVDADTGQVISPSDSRYQKILEFIDATDDSFFDLTGKRLFKPAIEDIGEKLYREGTDIFENTESGTFVTQVVSERQESDKRSFTDMAKQFGFDRSAPITEVTIGSILTSIINGPGTVQQKELARLLKSLLDGNEKISFVRNHYTNSTYDPKNGVIVDARYSSEDYKVLGMDKVSIEYSILSGLMQKLVVDKSADKEFTDKIKDIRESFMKELSEQQKNSYAYALANNTTFLSEMLTNPTFAALATQYEYKGTQVELTDKAKNIFGAFFKTLTDFIKKILNINNEERSVYKQALNVLANKLTEGPTEEAGKKEEGPDTSGIQEFSSLDPKLQEELKQAFEKKRTKVAATDPEVAKNMDFNMWYLNDFEATRIISNYNTKKKVKEEEEKGKATEGNTVITMANIPQLATALGYTVAEINSMILDGTPTQELLDIINNKVVSPNAAVLSEEGMGAINDAITDAKDKLTAAKLRLTEDAKNYIDDDGTIYTRVTSLVKDPFEADSQTASFRGTIIDDLTRDFLAGRIQNIEEFKDAYKISRDKISSKEGFSDKDAAELPIFTANFLNELFDNLRNVKRVLDRNGIKVVSDIPTLYGKLDGKDAAGSIDLLGYNSKGEVFIIDLKTASGDRNVQYALEEAMQDALGEDYAEFKSTLKKNKNYLEATRSMLPLEMQNKMTIAFTKFGNKYPEFKEEMQKGRLFLYKEGDQAQLAAYRELLRQSTGIVADKLYIFPMVASTEKGSSIKFVRNTMVKAPGRTGYVIDLTTNDTTYKISDLRQTVFEYPENPIQKPAAPEQGGLGKIETAPNPELVKRAAKFGFTEDNVKAMSMEERELIATATSKEDVKELVNKYIKPTAPISTDNQSDVEKELRKFATGLDEDEIKRVLSIPIQTIIDEVKKLASNNPNTKVLTLNMIYANRLIAEFRAILRIPLGDNTKLTEVVKLIDKLVPAAPTVSTDTKADIERRRQKELEGEKYFTKTNEEGVKAAKEYVDKINATYDAEYIDAVKKGTMTREQAMQALEEAGRKDSSAYVELAALEAGTQTNEQTEEETPKQVTKVAIINNSDIWSYTDGTYTVLHREDGVIGEYISDLASAKKIAREYKEESDYDATKKRAMSMVIGKRVVEAMWDPEKMMWRYFNKNTKEEYSFKNSLKFGKRLFRDNKGWFRTWWNQILDDNQRSEFANLYGKVRDFVYENEDGGVDPMTLEYVMMVNLQGVKFRKSKELTWATDVSEKVWFSDSGRNWDQFVMALKNSEDLTQSGIINETTEESELRDMIIDIMMRNPNGVTKKAVEALAKEISSEGRIQTEKDDFFDKTGIDFDDFEEIYESLGATKDIIYIDPYTGDKTEVEDKFGSKRKMPVKYDLLANQYRGKVIYITTDSSIQRDFESLGSYAETGNYFIEIVVDKYRKQLEDFAKTLKAQANSLDEDRQVDELFKVLQGNLYNSNGVMYRLSAISRAGNEKAKSFMDTIYLEALADAKKYTETESRTVVFDNPNALAYYQMFDTIIVNELSDIKRDAKTDSIDKAEQAVPKDKKVRLAATNGLDILKGVPQKSFVMNIKKRIGDIATKRDYLLMRMELNNAVTLGTLDIALREEGLTLEEVQSLLAQKGQEVANQLSIKDIKVGGKTPALYEYNDNGTTLILVAGDKGTDGVFFYDVTDIYNNMENATELDLKKTTKFRNLAEEEINLNLRPMDIEKIATTPSASTQTKSDSAQTEIKNDATSRVAALRAKKDTMDKQSTDDSLDDLFNCPIK